MCCDDAYTINTTYVGGFRRLKIRQRRLKRVTGHVTRTIEKVFAENQNSNIQCRQSRDNCTYDR